MQCVTDSASTIGLWASSSCSRSTPPLLHCGPSCHVPSPSLDKHIWTSVSVSLSLILSPASPPCELTLNWQWGWDEAPTDVVDRFLTQFSRCQWPAHAPTLLWKSNNLDMDYTNLQLKNRSSLNCLTQLMTAPLTPNPSLSGCLVVFVISPRSLFTPKGGVFKAKR